jgi:hypothetical protein
MISAIRKEAENEIFMGLKIRDNLKIISSIKGAKIAAIKK